MRSCGESRPGLQLRQMATVTGIGSPISRRPDIRGGRPCIAGTGVSVRRIAQWHNMGLIPEEIARKLGHLSLAQVHAALLSCQQTEIDADLEAEARATEALEQQHRRILFRIAAWLRRSRRGGHRIGDDSPELWRRHFRA